MTDDFEPIDLDFAVGEQLFTRGTDWRDAAMVAGMHSTDVPYMLGFKEAGDALVERGLETGMQNFVLFPALYCYRHAVELAMKEIIRLWERDQGRTGPPIRHDLLKAWERARQALEEAWPDGDAAQLDRMEGIIQELAAVDPKAEQFRYQRDTGGCPRELPMQVRHVDLRHVATVMNKLLYTLMGAVDGIDHMHSATPSGSEVS